MALRKHERRIGSLALALALTSIVDLAGPAVASADPAQDVVRRWRQAVHATSPAAPAEMHARWTAHEAGLSGTLDEWVTTNGEYRALTDRRFDRDEMMLAAGPAARRDWNGFVRRLDGDELRRARTSAFVTRVLAFGPPAEMAGAAVERDDQRGIYLLTVTPPGGAAVTWAIDQRSFLPLSMQRAGVVGTTNVTAAYSGWTAAGSGPIVPGRIVVTVSDQPPADYVLARPPTRGPIRQADFLRLRTGPSDVAMTGGGAAIPFTMEADHIVLQVRVNGRSPIGFILDTGDGHETLNAPRLGQFGVSRYGAGGASGGGGQTGSSYARDVTFTLPGGVALRHQHADAIDISGLERLFGIPLGGLLGYDFLSRFVVEIDYQARLIRLHRPENWHYRGRGVSVPITFDDGIPFVEATLSVPTRPALAAHMVIDFGAADTMTLTAPFVRANDLVRLAGTNARANSIPGSEREFFSQNNMRGRIDRLRLGGLMQSGIPVSLSANSAGAYGVGQFAGTIGEAIFSRYHVFLDYPRHRIVFEPTDRTDLPFPERRTFGLTLQAFGDDFHIFKVTGVRAGSPAAAAGFRVGDVVSSLDGRPAAAFSLAELRAVLALADQRHSAGITREGAQIELPFTVTTISIDSRPAP